MLEMIKPKDNETFVIFSKGQGMVRKGWPYRISHTTDNSVLIAEPYEDGSLPDHGIHYISVAAYIEEDDAVFIRKNFDSMTYEEIIDFLASKPEPAPTANSAKDTNPKEAIGQAKVPYHMIPDGPLALTSMAFFEGGTKYGPYNWRVAGVRASTYVSAVRRHLSKWWNGDDTDPHSRVHHLANAAAGLFILMDAELQDKLNDDRPPKQDLENLYVKLEGVMAHLRELNKDKNPPNYTEKEHGNAL